MLALALVACAGDRPKRGFRSVSDTPVKVGAPYRAGGRTWVPVDDHDYDAVGYASWYGAAHAGRPTANGEPFRPARISAAHPTLPLPSYVEVTALATGRTVLVRVNDRGPFVASRIIDLSEAAADALGLKRQGVAPVRVRRVEPPEADRAALRAGRTARPRPDAGGTVLAGLRARLSGAAADPSRHSASGEGRLRNSATTANAIGGRSGPPSPVGGGRGASPGQAASVPPQPLGPTYEAGATEEATAVVSREAKRGRGPGSTRMTAANGADAAGASRFVEIATPDDPDRADGLAADVSRLAPARVVTVDGAYRVRLGPFVDDAAAQAVLESLARSGYHDARIAR